MAETTRLQGAESGIDEGPATLAMSPEPLDVFEIAGGAPRFDDLQAARDVAAVLLRHCPAARSLSPADLDNLAWGAAQAALRHARVRTVMEASLYPPEQGVSARAASRLVRQAVSGWWAAFRIFQEPVPSSPASLTAMS